VCEVVNWLLSCHLKSTQWDKGLYGGPGCWWVELQDVPTGELPRNLLLAVDRSMVQCIVPGTRVTVVGIYSIFQAGGNKPQ
jgi:hypothetical protein